MASYDLSELAVLVVDDNRHMRALIKELLRFIGITRISEAEDGMSGFQQLRGDPPDIIVTDLVMRPIDGLEFSRMVRNERRSPSPYVPIIMVTGFADKQRVEEARDAGVTEFLAKPLTAGALYARLATIIERPRSYVRSIDYFGPDRRRRDAMTPSDGDRRNDAYAPGTPAPLAVPGT